MRIAGWIAIVIAVLALAFAGINCWELETPGTTAQEYAYYLGSQAEARREVEIESNERLMWHEATVGLAFLVSGIALLGADKKLRHNPRHS